METFSEIEKALSAQKPKKTKKIGSDDAKDVHQIQEELFRVSALRSSRDPSNLKKVTIIEAVGSMLGSQTPVGYFAAILGSLKSTQSIAASTEKMEMLINTLGVFDLLLPKTPVAIIKSQSNVIADVLNQITASHLQHCTEPEGPLLFSQTATVIQTLGSSLPDIMPELHNTLKNFLSLTTFPKIEVSTSGVKGVKAGLTGSSSNFKSTWSTTVVNFETQILKKLSQNKEIPEASSIFPLIQETLPYFNLNSINTMSTRLFELSGDSTMIIPFFLSFSGLFDLSLSGTTSLSGEWINKFITSILPLRPQDNAIAMTAFSSLLGAAFLKLNSVDPKLCQKKLHEPFQILMENFKSENPQLHSVTANCLTSLINECITDQDVAEISQNSKKSETPIDKIITCIGEGMGYMYKHAWENIFPVMGALFGKFGNVPMGPLTGLFQSLGELVESREFYSENLMKILMGTLGTILAAIGPREFLAQLPMNLMGDSKEIPSRTWILNLLKSKNFDGDLLFFSEYFAPMAEQLREEIPNLSDSHGKHNYSLYIQIWDLFPIMANTSRWKESAKFLTSFAPTLGDYIRQRPELRRPICLGLTNMIKSVKDHVSEPAAKQVLDLLAEYSKNFLPLMFTQFVSVEEEERHYLRQIVQEYIGISGKKAVASFFKNVMSKYLEEDTSHVKLEGEEEKRLSSLKMQNLIELAICFIPSLSLEQVHFFLKAIKPRLDMKKGVNKKLQKRSFKAVMKMCQLNPNFVENSLPELKSILIDTIAQSAPVAKEYRLRALGAIVQHVKLNDHVDFLKSILSEVILCLKEASKKPRQAAYDTLIAMGYSMGEDHIQEFLIMTMAGLAGATPHMISATISAISRILYEFSGSLDKTFQGQLLVPLVTLIGTNVLENVRACLLFVKVGLIFLPRDVWEPNIPLLMQKLGEISEKNHKQVRVTLGRVYEKLLRKFGSEKIEHLVPAADQRQFSYTRRMENRKLKKSQNRSQEEDQPQSFEDLARDATEEEEDLQVEKSKKRSSAADDLTSDMTLIEGEDPVDFMDASSTMKSVLFGDRNKRRADDMDDDQQVEYDEDGKFIFAEPAKHKSGDDDDESENYYMEQWADPDADDASHGNGAKKRGSKEDKRGTKRQKEKHSGAEYRAKKGGGDIKKAGKVEPYAYVPLDPRYLNKRNKTKSEGQFSSIVTAAKKGAKAKKSRPNKRG
eukprot:TRINITY_DN2761_c0_g2_i1.p1 TRINITY_DN2761_c0_g2~~TRINITY_DN2761_c0_g2_i1.p1  ORF type:complete len:1210 (-),score=457.79 TRINITY_DN2761_c0_g2_i1:9-3608(-)